MWDPQRGTANCSHGQGWGVWRFAVAGLAVSSLNWAMVAGHDMEELLGPWGSFNAMARFAQQDTWNLTFVMASTATPSTICFAGPSQSRWGLLFHSHHGSRLAGV